MKTITTSDLLTNTNNYFDFVSKKSKPIKVKGESKNDDIVLMTHKEYRSLMETTHLLSSKKNRERLHESIKSIRK